ncbi:DUF3219 family protein [Metabacillus sp. RGM 3146]|uniref:DUF3219 family protein n=1 Tax=Metabacillus sp. RGM 3146 TaxID=3401092 RepID=UPI003B9BF9C9
MVNEVILNDISFKVFDFEELSIDGKKKVRFHFKVNSGKEYHDVTTLLYQNSFTVKVPELDLSFKGTIYHYSTSVTNLYEENSIGDFDLGLTE